MALPSSGNLALSQIKAEWSGPNNLRAYLKGAGYVTAGDTAPNVPSSGDITMRANFLGAAKVASPFVNWDTTSGWDFPTTIQAGVATPTSAWVSGSAPSSYQDCWRTIDGVNWVRMGNGPRGQMVYCNGKLWARSILASPPAYITYSSDYDSESPTWNNTPNFNNAYISNGCRMVAGDGLLIVFGLYQNTTTFLTTTDGTSWTSRTLPTAYPSAFVYLPGDAYYKYRVVRTSTGHWGSNDLVTWSGNLGAFTYAFARSTYDDFGLYAYGNGVHIEIESGNMGYIRKAEGDSTWARYTISGFSYPRRVTFMNGKFFIPPSGTITGKTSSDGITWTDVTTNINNPQANGLVSFPPFSQCFYSANNSTSLFRSY